jgi:hypothetical protein
MNMKFIETWDLSTIPDDRLRAEWGRRNSSRRKTFGGGRNRSTLACPFCYEFFSAAELRGHRSGCRQKKLQALLDENRHVFIVPTFDDLNAAGFALASLSRETLRLEKLGYGDVAEVPTRAILNISASENDRMHAQIAVAGRLDFDKVKGCWVFSEGAFDLSGVGPIAPWAIR